MATKFPIVLANIKPNKYRQNYRSVCSCMIQTSQNDNYKRLVYSHISHNTNNRNMECFP